MQLNLFQDQYVVLKNKGKCRNCKHFFKTNYYGYKANYCRIIASKRTDNGFLKVKALQLACDKYEANK